MKIMMHRNKDGQYIDIDDMSDIQLISTIRTIRTIADKGFIAKGEGPLHGDDALYYMGLGNYLTELNKRGLKEI